MLSPSTSATFSSPAEGEETEDALREAPKKRLVVRRVRDMVDEPPKPWLIEGFLGEGDVAIITGLPGTGKTFVALAIGAAIVKGCGEFAGRFRVKRSRPVVYVGGEKRRGLPARLRATLRAEGLPDDAPLYDAFPMPQLFDSTAGMSVEEFCAELVEEVPSPGLVVIDTLNRATIGMKENAVEEMGIAIASASRIAEVLKTAVLLVHHSPKNDSDGSRGSNSLEGAVDTALAVIRDMNGKRTLKATKQGDDEEFGAIGFTLIPDAVSQSVSVDWSAPRAATTETSKSAGDRVVQALEDDAWFTAHEVAERADVAPKTAQNVLGSLAKHGRVAKRLSDECAKASRNNPSVYRRADVPESGSL